MKLEKKCRNNANTQFTFLQGPAFDEVCRGDANCKNMRGLVGDFLKQK